MALSITERREIITNLLREHYIPTQALIQKELRKIGHRITLGVITADLKVIGARKQGEFWKVPISFTDAHASEFPILENTDTPILIRKEWLVPKKSRLTFHNQKDDEITGAQAATACLVFCINFFILSYVAMILIGALGLPLGFWSSAAVVALTKVATFDKGPLTLDIKGKKKVTP